MYTRDGLQASSLSVRRNLGELGACSGDVELRSQSLTRASQRALQL